MSGALARTCQDHRPHGTAGWRLRPGRRIRRSPPWNSDGDSVIVFDAASGDYWVLGPGADSQLRAVESAGSDGHRSEVAGDIEMLAELQDCGLISPVA